MGFFLGLASNMAANVLFWALLGLVFWVLTTTVARRFSRFFGLARVNNVAILLSNLWDPRVGGSGRPEGYTLSLHELWAAQAVDRLFSSASLRLPDLVRGLVDAIWLRGRPQCVIEVSPIKAEKVDLNRNLIVVGSSARNSVRASYVRAGMPTAIPRNSVRASYVRAGMPTAILTGEDQMPDAWRMMKEAHSITIKRSGTESEVNFTDLNLALVEKHHDPGRGTTIFFCLGLRADGTWAAAEYLVRNWKQLASEFGEAEFVVCLGFPKTEAYASDYREPIRLSVGGR